ncbi:hypothetical protein ACO0K1_06105 [Undibacterium sp. SXout20W]
MSISATDSMSDSMSDSISDSIFYMSANARATLTRRLSVGLLMLLMHGLLWLAWQTQTTFKIIRDAPTTYLQLLQIPLPKKLTQPDKSISVAVVPTPIQTRIPKKTSASNAMTISPETVTSEISSSNMTTPTTEATPHLDLDALRVTAMTMEKQRRHSEIEKIQDSLKRDDSFEKKLGEGVKRAQVKDCAHAYSGLGLLAIIPLAASAVSDKVCKW